MKAHTTARNSSIDKKENQHRIMTFPGRSLSFTYTANVRFKLRISQNIENNRIKTNLMDKKLRETTNLWVEKIGTVTDK